MLTTTRPCGQSHQNVKESRLRMEKSNLVLLKPLLIFIRFTGIELDPLRQFSSRDTWLSWIGLSMFTINVWSNLYFTHFALSRSAQLDPSISHGTSSISSLGSLIIDYCSFDFMVMAVHAALLCLTRKMEWKMLWSNLNYLEDHNSASAASASSIKKRRIVIAGFTFLIFVKPYLLCIFSLGVWLINHSVETGNNLEYWSWFLLGYSLQLR